MIPEFIKQDLQALELSLDPQVLEQLDEYLESLLETNRQLNLTAIRDRDHAWRRLIVDSLTPLRLLDLKSNSRVVDVGTGAGLPGLPLAIARPDLQFSLIDSTGKKIAFLESVVEQLELTNVQLYADRVESLGQANEHRGTYDLAISRAVGPMTMMLEYCLPLLHIGGRVLAMKGPKAVEELDLCTRALSKLGGGEVRMHPAYPQSFENDLVLVQVTKVMATPRAYPRLPGTPKRDPL